MTKNHEEPLLLVWREGWGGGGGGGTVGGRMRCKHTNLPETFLLLQLWRTSTKNMCKIMQPLKRIKTTKKKGKQALSYFLAPT